MAEVDVVVLGLGVGGEQVAGALAEAGLSVVGIERRLVGGECPYFGCVPTKMMIRASNVIAEARRVDGLAGRATVTPDWAPVAARIRADATDNWDDKVAVDRFTSKGGHFVRGSGRLTGPRSIAVGGDEWTVRRGIVINTGTAPSIPPIDGLADTPYWTNRDAVKVATLPASLLVLGGGAIGLELAQVFARFGVRITIIEPSDRLLSMEEPESSAAAEKAIAADGATVHLGVSATRVTHDGHGFTIALSDGGQVSGERLLVATGRTAHLADLGLDAAGLDPTGRAIAVNDRLRAAERIWAVGDVTGKGAFTHVATYQANIVIRDILGQDGPPADYAALPRVTFTDPEIGAVGLTEAQARDQGIRVRTGFYDLPKSTRGFIHKLGNEGFIKLVADADRDVLVGATSAGPMGGEVLSALAVAVHAKVPLATMRSMIYAYPTFHRAIEPALEDLG